MDTSVRQSSPFFVQNMIGDMIREMKFSERKPRWCKRCGRKHNSKCDLVEVERVAKKSGKMVTRLIHASLVTNDGKVIANA